MGECLWYQQYQSLWILKSSNLRVQIGLKYLKLWKLTRLY
jgi:hypothetical protein